MKSLLVITLIVAVLEICEGANRPYNCPKLKLSYGRVRLRQKGHLARFVCYPGYLLAGSRYSTCVNGTWDEPNPKCVRPTCTAVKQPINGIIYPSHSGAVLHFYCKAGFEIRGNPIVYCDGNRWDSISPSCLLSGTSPSLTCDFEAEDLCGWTHDTNHDFDWTRHSSKTPSWSVGTGPSYDHTKGEGQNGYYMYIESSSQNLNDTARLISPIFDKIGSNACLEFYYHMWGANTGTLRAYLKLTSTNSWILNANQSVFSKSGNQGNRWFRSVLDLGNITEDYQIVFEGIRGYGYQSDIAIDDVTITPNCNYQDEIVSTTTEWEDEGTTEEPLRVESCEDRCGLNATNITEHDNEIVCDCDDFCYERDRCCPDWLDLCALPMLTEETIPDESTSNKPITTIRNEPTRTETTIQISSTVKKTSPTRRPIVILTPPLETTLIEWRPIPSTQKTTELDYDSVEDVEEIPTMTNDDKEFDLHDDMIMQQSSIKIAETTRPDNMLLTIFLASLAVSVTLSIVIALFAVRRYRSGLWCGTGSRIRQSSNGESASDVRYLTGDDEINLSLPHNYDNL